MTKQSAAWASGLQSLRMLSALQAKDVGIIEEELIKLSQRGVPCSGFDVAQLYEVADLIHPSALEARRWYEWGRENEQDPRCMFALARFITPDCWAFP